MMLLLLCAVAVTAALHPCELCTCSTSDEHFPAHRPDCECRYKEVKFHEKPVDTAIYYEPADYISKPTLIYDQPFYIINPYVATRGLDPIDTDNSGLNINPYNTYFVPNTGIGTGLTSHERKVKDIQADTNRRSSIYLDINVEPKDKSTIEILNAEGIQLTEPDLLECADLYITLEFRKSNNKNHLSTEYPNPLQQYEHLSNNDLIRFINDKCSYVLQIVEKSQKEIKETRPKKTNHKLFKLKDQDNNKLQVDNDIMHSNINNDRNTETNVILSVEPGKDNSDIEKDDNNQVDEENTVDTIADTTLLSEAPFTTVASSLDQDVYTTLSQYSTIEDIEDNPETTNTQETFTDIDVDMKDSTPHHETMASMNKSEQSENHRSIEDELMAKETEKYNDNRTRYEEGEVQLVKVITQEFNNNTVHSFIDGTEDLPNGDFENDFHSTNSEISVYDKSLLTVSKANVPRVVDKMRDQSLDISGKIYFLFNDRQIPARFIQKPNGTLHLGVDGASLCNLLTKEEPKSILLTTLCDCYKNDKCISGD